MHSALNESTSHFLCLVTLPMRGYQVDPVLSGGIHYTRVYSPESALVFFPISGDCGDA